MSPLPEEILIWLEEDKSALEELEILADTDLSSINKIVVFGEAVKALLYLDACNTPQWAVDAYYNILQKYVDNNWVLLFANFIRTKIRGGPMVTEMVNNMVQVAKNEDSGKNFIIWSGHDTSIASLAYALRVGDQLPSEINYADSIMVDLVQKGTAEPTVEVIYLSRLNTIPQMIPMNVPGCGVSCTLTAFRAATSEMMVEDWDALCAV